MASSSFTPGRRESPRRDSLSSEALSGHVSPESHPRPTRGWALHQGLQPWLFGGIPVESLIHRPCRPTGDKSPAVLALIRPALADLECSVSFCTALKGLRSFFPQEGRSFCTAHRSRWALDLSSRRKVDL